MFVRLWKAFSAVSLEPYTIDHCSASSCSGSITYHHNTKHSFWSALFVVPTQILVVPTQILWKVHCLPVNNNGKYRLSLLFITCKTLIMLLDIIVQCSNIYKRNLFDFQFFFPKWFYLLVYYNVADSASICTANIFISNNDNYGVSILVRAQTSCYWASVFMQSLIA